MDNEVRNLISVYTHTVTCIHGTHTHCNCLITQSATFDYDLLYKFASAVSDEVRAKVTRSMQGMCGASAAKEHCA